MSPDLDKQLCEKYPKIFARVTWTEHDDGWYHIIDSLCATIQSHINHKRKTEPFASLTNEEFDEIHQTRIAQVKEKFAGLRFYVDNADDYVRGAIDNAENISFKICEICSSPGHKGNSRRTWIKTLCEKCDRRNKDPNVTC